MKRMRLAGVGLATVGCIALGGTVPALAAPASPPSGQNSVHPDRCPSNVYYTTWGAHGNYRDMVSPAWGGPGITLSIALTRGHTVTTTLGGSGSFSASAIVASAKVDISASIAYAMTSSVTYTGSGTIPSSWSRGGYLHAGAHRYSYSWEHYESTPQCTDVVLGRGTATSPNHIPSFWKSAA